MVTRLSGLASGMDTEKMVSDLMKAHRVKLDKIQQKKQYVEWQRDDYRTVNKKLFDFRTLTNDTMIRQSTFAQKTASSSSPDDVSVRNVSSMSNFSGTLSVQQLAEKATMRSTGAISPSTIDVNAKLSTSAGLVGTQTIKIKAIKEDGTLQSDSEAFNFTFDPTQKSLQDVLSEINTKSNVTAFYDSFTRQIQMTAKNSGDATGNEIEISDTAGGFFTFAKLFDPLVAIPAVANNGKNAQFTLDGLATERSSNTFTINGFELTLKKASNTNVTFTSVTDTDKVFDSVKKFIDDYNSLIENLNGELRETRYRDYQPLTSDQKQSMKDKEIDLWEEKAKSGTLRNDSILSSMLNKMRSLLNASVSGVTGADRLSEIGITPSTNRLDNGKLIINESKLREAITADPNQVYELFAANGTKNSDGTLNADNGLARRLVSILDDARTQVIAKAGSEGSVNNKFTLGRELNSYNDQINRYEDRLKSIESRYWKQFTAMETSIQKANSQSAQVMNYFSNGN